MEWTWNLTANVPLAGLSILFLMEIPQQSDPLVPVKSWPPFPIQSDPPVLDTES